ncbi:MAG: sigma-54-dependent Fis family transcriptional regulator [Proteobacteria bacterium]|nr:sigma-54-dependent Fis family transcriptional regulator [Pseudomonadota bacterium]
MAHDILIVDDEADIRELISGILEDEGYTARTAQDGFQAIEEIKKRQPSLVILDVWLGDSERDGLKILDQIKRDHPYVPVIMISGHGTIETAVHAIKKGAYDFIEKPFQTERLFFIIERALESARLKKENDVLKKHTRQETILLGQSAAIHQVRQAIAKAAPTNSRVFIFGPSGSCKEAIAKAIHSQSKRSKGPLEVLNCASSHVDQIEADLFGTEIIGLSSDTPRKIGLLEQSHLGTLFLDEVTALPLNIQNKLIRVLQEQTFCRLGSTQKIHVDVRFIASSCIDVLSLIKKEQFREDLYYRLSVIPIHVPPLKERLIDIPVLLEDAMEQLSATYGLIPRRFTEEAIIVLQSYHWPGNLRQLRNVVEWVLIMNHSDPKEPIRSDMLPPEIRSGIPFSCDWSKTADLLSLPLREAREAFERDYLLAQVNRFGGNISQTARFIGMERSALHRKLKALGVHDPKSSDLEAGEEINVA